MEDRLWMDFINTEEFPYSAQRDGKASYTLGGLLPPKYVIGQFNQERCIQS